MAVALDAAGTGSTGVAATSFNAAGDITVGAGSNRILIIGVQFGGDPGTITACNWDSGGTPQAMTQVGTLTFESGSLGSGTIFALIAPTAGAKNVNVAWTNSVSWTRGLISFTGADQGSVSGTCKNFVSGSPSTGGASSDYPVGGATINSPVGDFCVLFGESNGAGVATTGGLGTNLYALSTNISGFGRYTTGGGAATLLAGRKDGNAPTFPASYVGCDIAAVGTVSSPVVAADTSVGVFGGFSSVIRIPRIVSY